MSIPLKAIEEIERHDRERFERLGLTKDEASIFTMIHIDPRGNLMLRWTIGHNKTPEDFVRTINSGLRKIVEAGEDEIFTDCIAELHEDAVYMKRIGGGRPAVFPLDEDEWEEGDYEYCPEDELFHRRKDRSGLQGTHRPILVPCSGPPTTFSPFLVNRSWKKWKTKKLQPSSRSRRRTAA